MGQSLAKRFAGRESELKRQVLLHGVDPVAEQEGVSLGAMLNYAKDVLQLPDAPIVSQTHLVSTSELSLELVHALFTKWKKIEAENERLKVELREAQRVNELREQTAKLELIQLLDSVQQ